MELEELYSNYLSGKGNVREVLDQTHWFSTISDFDLLTREALPQTLSSVLQKVSQYKPYSVKNPSSILKDRLWRIVEHAREPLDNLLRNLNESPQRDHAVLPVYAVRELDTPSFMALARRPGCNIREKLAGKPYLQAVRRFQSVDLPENRLLKAFSEQLADLLELRVECLQDDDSDELLYSIRSWLTTDEAQSISRWENLPPNNTLLSHRDYRRIWDCWGWLQSLEDDISNDITMLKERRNTMQKWGKFGKMFLEQKYIFAEIPVMFDYDSFGIRLWGRMWNDKDFPLNESKPLNRPNDLEPIYAPTCLDLTELYPLYAYAFLTDQEISSLKKYPRPFLWQCWDNKDVSGSSFNMNLFNADAVYLHKDATTISSFELLFSNNHTIKCLENAAHEFAKKLRETFKNDTLIWLQPDYLNDFELQITRSNINALFPNAEPLPRSIAAVFEEIYNSKIEYSRLFEGYIVAVYDYINGKKCVTKLEVKYKRELKKRIPQSYGFYFERYPTKILPNDSFYENSDNSSYDIFTFNSEGFFSEPKKQPTQRRKHMNLNQEIGSNYDYPIDLTNHSPVQGGIVYYALQQIDGSIPLWRDQIPVLSIDEAYVDGVPQSFPLVPPKTPIIPIRGKTIPIHVKGSFTLQKGIDQYPLVMGENDDEVGYSAKLDSPDLPLQEDLECNLKLTFTYGVDDPYCLIFEPVNNKSIQPIRVKWEKTKEEIVKDAPAPEYPAPIMWEQLQKSPKKKNSYETRDLLEWVLSSVNYLDNSLYLSKREIGVITHDWRPIRNGDGFYTIVYCQNIGKNVIIYEDGFINGYTYSDFPRGSTVSFVLYKRNDGQYKGLQVSNSMYQEERRLKEFDEEMTNTIINIIHSSLYVPVIQIWRDGRSIDDASCPLEFRSAMIKNIAYLDYLTQQPDIPQPIKDEILFLLSCLHKDAPNNCIQWITEQIGILNSYDKRDAELQEERTVNQRKAIGFALGDLSKPWQMKLFNNLKAPLKTPFNFKGYLTRKANNSLRIFTYAIWREQHFVEQFNLSECQTILNCLIVILSNIEPKQNENNGQWTIPIWELEFLLGMLRIRSSSNEDIKMLLQPHRKITKELAKQVKRIIRIVVKYGIPLKSRIDLGDLRKRSDDKSPDLLYALLRNLTGKNGENAIRITDVSDNSID